MGYTCYQEAAVADTNPKKEGSLGALFADLSDKTTLLIRQEIDLAKQEMTDKVKRAAMDVVSFLVGAFIAYIGLLALIAAAAIALALVLPDWVATLIVGLLVIAVGGIMIMVGINSLKDINLKPERTINTLKDNQTLADDAKAAKERS